VETIKGAIAGIVALVTCPCHLPITLPIILALISGTTVGVWLLSNQWAVWLLSTILFLGGLALAVHWFTREDHAAQCELPTQKQARGGKLQSGASPRF